MRPFLRYYCHYGSLTGYGRAARDNLLALARFAPDLRLEIIDLGSEGSSRSPEPRYRALDELVLGRGALPEVRALEAGGYPPPDVALYHAPPRTLATLEWPEAPTVKRIAYTTWETSRLPPEYQAPLFARYDRILTPSRYSLAAIGGVSTYEEAKKLAVVPHGFDPTFWTMADPRGRDGSTRFYTIGAWGERKNPLGVLKAYLAAFTAVDPVTLVMILEGVDLAAVRATIACSGLPDSQIPKMIIPSETALDEQQLLELHQGGDCFVSATRGEAWGLGMFESAVMGNRVIAPRHGGQSDFLENYHLSYEVNATLTPCFGSEVRGPIVEGPHGLMQSSTVAIPPGVTCKQDWYDPDIGGLADAMAAAHLARGYLEVDGTTPLDLGNPETSPEAPGERARRQEMRAHLERSYGYENLAKMLREEILR